MSELVDRVARQQDRVGQQDRVVVTRNGQPPFVLVSTDDLERLEETLAVMSDGSVAAQIRESKKAAVRGEEGVGLLREARIRARESEQGRVPFVPGERDRVVERQVVDTARGDEPIPMRRWRDR